MTTPLTPFLSNPNEIQEWLAEYCDIDGAITISEAGVVSVEGSVVFKSYRVQTLWLTQFEVQFDHVSGDFTSWNMKKLSTLRGGPVTVGGTFSVHGCTSLPNLLGSPTHVGGGVSIKGCTNLATLEGAPLTVGDAFNCGHCSRLTTLVGSPLSVGGEFHCVGCDNLVSLEGAPAHIGGGFNCVSCPNLKSLKGLPVVAGYLGFMKVEKPDPALVIAFLQNRVELVTTQKAKWISIVNDYHASDDLLTAVAQFEKYYKVPFATPEDSLTTLPVLTL